MIISFFKNNIWIIVVLAVWELIWKGIALWEASRNKQKNWFIILLLVNSIGVLPLVYIKFFKFKKKEVKIYAGDKKRRN